MKIKLTERTVTRLKPPTGRVFVDVWDQTLPAFGIQLRATGRRAWIIAVRRPGKSTTSRIKIGDPATMSLADARERARELMRDPSSLELEEPEPEPDAIDPDSLTADSPIDGGDRWLHSARSEAAEPELEVRRADSPARSHGLVRPAASAASPGRT